MAAIILDTDIAGATASTTPGSLTLDKINAQHYRTALENLRTHQQALIDNEREALNIARAQRDLTFRQQVALALANKFMARSTSTVVATYTAATALDGQKLKAAIDAVLAAAAEPTP